MTNIAIIGGHGKVALRLAPLLVEAGDEVTSWIRKEEQIEDIEQTGATAKVLDVQQLSTEQLSDEFEGVDVIIWSAGAGGGDPERTWAVDRDAAIRTMDAAEKAGVGRYVMVSYQGSTLEHGLSEDHGFYPYVQAKAEADETLRRSDLDWTILGPGFLTDDEPTGTIGLGPIEEFGGDRQSPGPNGERNISRSDVAQTIVDALDMPETVGKFIEYGRGETPIREALAR